MLYSEDLSPCNLILAVKEIPINLLIENKAYIFFTHSVKGQKSSLPLLKQVLQKRISLFDYELI
jgi:saccharopine dehydrogenase (NAD+, L-lysine-forming)